jgi:hypothetical protein
MVSELFIPIIDRADWIIQSRLLLGALVCAVLLIAGYLALVSTSWGHQLDDDAYFGRNALNRKVIRLDGARPSHQGGAAAGGGRPVRYRSGPPLYLCWCDRRGGIWMRGRGLGLGSA